MRISDITIANNYLTSVNDIKTEMDKLSGQISTSKVINKPSDNPTTAVKLLSINKKINNVDTYLSNISDSRTFMEETIRSMENIQTEISSLQIKLVEVMDDSKTGSLDTYADIIDASIETILSSANQKYDGKYLFGGNDFSDKPFGFTSDNSSVEVKTSAVDGEQLVNISSSAVQKLNFNGEDLFGVSSQGDQIDIFTTLISIRDNLRAGIKPADAEYKVIEDFNTNILDNISNAGNIVVKFDNTEEMLTNQQTLLQGLVEKENSVDIAKAVMDLQYYDFLLQTSYQTASMILPKSLLNYL